MNYERIPYELKKLNRWVCAYADDKTPMCAFENKPASSTNVSTWGSFNTSVEAVECGAYDDIGFVFNENDGYVGVDIDDGYTEEGFISELAADVIASCQSYTEKSRSGRGFHIILRGHIPFKGKNNLSGLEIYKSSRYFIMTGKTILFNTIINNQTAIDYIVDKYFQCDVRQSAKHVSSSNKIYKPDWSDPVREHRLRLKPDYPNIHSGSRNLSLASLAGSMHSLGYSREQIFKELCFVNKSKCSPPLQESEIRNICKSITRYTR